MSARRIALTGAVAAITAAVLVLAFAGNNATARGSGAHGAFGRSSDHAFFGDHFRDFDRDRFRHFELHDRFGHHFHHRDFGHWHVRDARFGNSHPGEWHLSSGFGGNGHWSQRGEGAWGR